VHYPPDFTGMLHPHDMGIKEYLKRLYMKHLVQKGCVEKDVKFCFVKIRSTIVA